MRMKGFLFLKKKNNRYTSSISLHLLYLFNIYSFIYLSFLLLASKSLFLIEPHASERLYSTLYKHRGLNSMLLYRSSPSCSNVG